MSILYNENIGCQKYRWSKKALTVVWRLYTSGIDTT